MYQYSVSQIESWLLCQRKWAFRYVDRKKRPRTLSARIGVIVHAIAEFYLTWGCFPSSIPSEIDAEFLRDGEEPCSLSEYASAMRAAQAMGTHLDQLVAAKAVPEGEFLFQSPSARWRGYKDATLRSEDRAVIVDFKTTKDAKYTKTAIELIALGDVQAVVYAVDEFLRNPKLDEITLGWLYCLVDPKRSSAWLVEGKITRETAFRYFAFLDSTAAEISTKRKSLNVAHDYAPTASACDAYGGCPYRGDCNLSPLERLLGSMTTQAPTNIFALMSAAAVPPATPEAPTAPTAAALGFGPPAAAGAAGAAAAPPALAAPAQVVEDASARLFPNAQGMPTVAPNGFPLAPPWIESGQVPIVKDGNVVGQMPIRPVTVDKVAILNELAAQYAAYSGGAVVQPVNPPERAHAMTPTAAQVVEERGGDASQASAGLGYVPVAPAVSAPPVVPIGGFGATPPAQGSSWTDPHDGSILDAATAARRYGWQGDGTGLLTRDASGRVLRTMTDRPLHPETVKLQRLTQGPGKGAWIRPYTAEAAANLEADAQAYADAQDMDAAASAAVDATTPAQVAAAGGEPAKKKRGRPAKTATAAAPVGTAAGAPVEGAGGVPLARAATAAAPTVTEAEAGPRKPIALLLVDCKGAIFASEEAVRGKVQVSSAEIIGIANQRIAEDFNVADYSHFEGGTGPGVLRAYVAEHLDALPAEVVHIVHLGSTPEDLICASAFLGRAEIVVRG